MIPDSKMLRLNPIIPRKELGQPFNVVNRTGGSGVVGHSAIAYAKPDGYTIGLATVELTMMHWVGLTKLTYKDVTPVAFVNSDPAGVMVANDASWKNVNDFMASVKSQPGRMKGSGTGQGGIWHLALAGMLGYLGRRYQVYPSDPDQCESKNQ